MRDCGRKIHGLHAARPGSFNSRKTQRSLRMTIHPRNTKGAAMGCASVKEFTLYFYYTNFSRETGHACPIYFPFLLSSLTSIRLYCPLDKVFHRPIFGSCDG